MSTGVPSDNGDYNPKSIGTRPAYGWYLHNISGITFTNSSVRFKSDDGRPAFIANTGSNVKLDHFTVQHGKNAPFDIGFQNINGYCVTNGGRTGGGAPGVNATGSSKSC